MAKAAWLTQAQNLAFCLLMALLGSLYVGGRFMWGLGWRVLVHYCFLLYINIIRAENISWALLPKQKVSKSDGADGRSCISAPSGRCHIGLFRCAGATEMYRYLRVRLWKLLWFVVYVLDVTVLVGGVRQGYWVLGWLASCVLWVFFFWWHVWGLFVLFLYVWVFWGEVGGGFFMVVWEFGEWRGGVWGCNQIESSQVLWSI